jgi:hypothetical protein
MDKHSLDSIATEEFEFLIGEALNGTDEAKENALKLINNLIEFETNRIPVSIEWPEDLSRYTYNQLEEGMGQFNKYIDYLLNGLEKVNNVLSGVQNQITYESTSLRERLNRLKNKIGAYSLYGNENVNSVIYSFQNREEFTTEGNPNLSFTDKGATLPIVEASKIRIKALAIGRQSNGVIGNPFSYGSGLSMISSVTDESPYTLFTYSSRNSTTKLVFDLELNSNSIVNCLSLEFTSSYLSSLKLEKLEAVDNSGKTVTLLSDIALERLGGTLYFPPIQTSKLKVTIQSSGLIEGVPWPGEVIGQSYSAVTIRDLSIYSVRFQSVGELISKVKTTNGSQVDFRKLLIGDDKEFNLFDFQIFVRKNEAWQEIGLAESFMEFADITDLQFKIKIVSNNSKFEKNYGEVLLKAKKDYIVESFLTSSLNSNSTYTTTSKFKDLRLLTALKYRTDNEWLPIDRARVSSTETENTLFYIDNQNIKKEDISRMNLFINGVLKPKNLLSLTEINGQKYIVVGESLSSNSEVQLSVEPELMEPYMESNRAWDRKTFNTSASIVPNSIVVHELADIPVAPIVELITPGANFHQCRNRHIFNVSVGNDSGVYLTEVPYEVNGALSAGEYRVDRVKGLIEFGARLTGYRCTYKYVNLQTIDPIKDYASGQVIVDSYKSHSIRETLGSSVPRKTIESSGIYYDRDLLFTLSSRVGHLSERSIVPGSLFLVNRSDTYKQIPFINGVTEFNSGSYGQTTLGEFTVDDFSIVRWQIPEASYINNLGIFPLNTALFLVKKDSVDSIAIEGDWAFDGEYLYLYTASRDLSSIDIGYFYNNFILSQYLYSVDYKRGKVYFSSNIGDLESIEVNYSIAHYYASYQAANEIDRSSFVAEDNVDSNSIKLLVRRLSDDVIFVVGNRFSDFYDPSLLEYYSPVLQFIEFGVV